MATVVEKVEFITNCLSFVFNYIDHHCNQPEQKNSHVGQKTHITFYNYNITHIHIQFIEMFLLLSIRAVVLSVCSI